jgi:site-specific recombinase XerD
MKLMTKMKLIFRVSFYLRTNYLNKKGEASIMIRAHLNYERLSFGSTGLKIDPTLWDKNKQCAKGRTSEAKAINASLDNIKFRLQSIVEEHHNEDLSLDKIKAIYDNKSIITKTFMEFYDKFVEDLHSEVGHGKTLATVQKYAKTRSHFREYIKSIGRKDLMPGELDASVIDGFSRFLRTEVGQNENTSVKTMKFFKTAVIHAQKIGFIHHDPFAGHRFHLKPVDRGFLTDEDIKNLMNKDFGIERLETVRDLFVFSCFTGLAYIDVANLKDSNIVVINGHKWIMTKRQKTGIPTNVILLDIAETILKKYEGKCKDNAVLPVISNQKMNAYLKEIADLCGIKKQLTFHMARHTFATMSLSKGVPIESVSKMLGHTNIKTTQIYARITNKKIEHDMLELSTKLDNFRTNDPQN